MKEIKKKFARTLRIEQTKAEKTVWELIRNRKFLNLKFRRQHVIEGFVLEGIKIIRIRNKEIVENKRSILEKIKKVISSSMSPSPFGRGGKE